VRRICDRVTLLKDNQIHEELSLVDGEIEPRTAFGKCFLEVL
jgi:ABC-type methionine transport system ATPase subunit